MLMSAELCFIQVNNTMNDVSCAERCEMKGTSWIWFLCFKEDQLGLTHQGHLDREKA